MSASAFLQLRDALAAHLMAAPALAGVPVYAGRVRPIAQEEASAINLRLSDSQAMASVIEASDWHTTVLIDCAARSVPGGADADTVADGLLDAVYALLHTFAPAGLGVLFLADGPTVEWDRVAEDVPYTCASLRITVVHRASRTTLQPWT